MDRTREEAAAARRAYAEQHAGLPAPREERRSLGDVLHDPYVVAATTAAATSAVNAAKARLKSTGGKHRADPRDED